MEYQFITQSDIQFMGDSMMLQRIASRCNEMIDIGYHSMRIFRIFYPRMDINFKAEVLDQLIMEAIKMDYDNELQKHAQSLRRHILQDEQYDGYAVDEHGQHCGKHHKGNKKRQLFIMHHPGQLHAKPAEKAGMRHTLYHDHHASDEYDSLPVDARTL